MLAVVVVWRLVAAAAHRFGGILATALTLAVVLVIVFVAGTVLTKRVPASGRRAPGGSRKLRWWRTVHGGEASTAAAWAAPRDLAALRVRGALPGRLVLGSCGRHLLAAEPGQSVIVVGPTQSQKTSGIAVPAILEWTGPVVATSVKTDLVRDTIDWRGGCGRVFVYDPAAATGLGSTGWSPISGSTTWPGARRVAAALCSVARSGPLGGMDDAGFWYSMAEKLLAPLLFAAAVSGGSMSDVCHWVDTEEVTEVQLALELAGVVEACRAARASFGREERQRSSVYATVESVLEAYSDPAVLASSERAELRPELLVDGASNTLYICAPAHEQERLQPVFVAVLRQVVEAALERSALLGRPLGPPMLVVLDEAANVAPVSDLDRLASTAAGHGVQLVTVFQDMAQIEGRYGTRAGTVVNNHRAKIVLSGISDPATLEHVSRLVGDEELVVPTTTIDPEGRRSRTDSAVTRPLAPAAWLRRIAPGGGVLVYGHLPPARLDLRPWFLDPALKEKVAGGSAGRASSGAGAGAGVNAAAPELRRLPALRRWLYRLVKTGDRTEAGP